MSVSFFSILLVDEVENNLIKQDKFPMAVLPPVATKLKWIIWFMYFI